MEQGIAPRVCLLAGFGVRDVADKDMGQVAMSDTIRIVSWNIGRSVQAWQLLVEEGIDLGLLQEAQAAPQHIASVSGLSRPHGTCAAAQSLAVGTYDDSSYSALI